MISVGFQLLINDYTVEPKRYILKYFQQILTTIIITFMAKIFEAGICQNL